MRLLTRPTKEIFAEFPAAETKLPDIRNFIENVMKETPFPRKDVTGILLAVEEACTNVIRHAYLMGEGTLKLKITLFADRLQLSIFDNGRSFDFEESSEPDLEHYIKTGRKGGLGIYLIRKITDEVSYHTHKGVNELRMVKRYPRVRQTAAVPQRGMSLRVKFSLWTSLVMAAIIVSAYLYWENKSVDSLRIQFTDQVFEESRTIASQAANYFLNSSSDVEFDEFVRNFANQDLDIVSINIIDRQNRLLASTASPERLHQLFEPPTQIDQTRYAEQQRFERGDGTPISYFVEQIKTSGRVFGEAHVAFSETGLSSSIARARRGILFVVWISFVFSMLAVYLL
ncbi:MAG: ATP-binding protein, partial [bacterium]